MVPESRKITKMYFSTSMESNISDEAAMIYQPATMRIDHSYRGQLNPQKRYLAIGFDDFRNSDFSMILPLFEKYGYRATFNKVIWGSDLSKDDKTQIDNLLYGGHELGDHTFLHQVYLYSDPLCNGQDPSNPEGNQIPFPTNEQLRTDRGDGKNVFGIDLTEKTSSLIYFEEFDVPFQDLTDDQCQSIRNYFSLMKENSGLLELLDTLSNRYLGTTGSSRGSWDPEKECYTGGIFTGCKTSQNHEVWERVLTLIDRFYKQEYGLNFNFYTWSLPGNKRSPFTFEKDGGKFYDAACTIHANYLAKMTSSLTQRSRSWTDVLRTYGYTISHDYLYPGRDDGQELPMMHKQFIYNAALSRKDALIYPTNRTIVYTDAGAAYSGNFFTEGKSKAAQMYDAGGTFYQFIEALRQDTSNGLVHGELYDSIDTQTDRIFWEEILRYCKETGVEVITKAEAYDLCFNHSLSHGNLIYNPTFRNTAREFMPDAETIPNAPDGYINDCYVTCDEDFVPILNIPDTNQVEYLHYGIPIGDLTFSLEAKGNNTIKIYAIRNKDSIQLLNDELLFLTEVKVTSPDAFDKYSVDFQIKNFPLTEYNQRCEEYGDKIMGIKIVYGEGLSVKKLNLHLQ